MDSVRPESSDDSAPTDRPRDFVLLSDWSILSQAAVNNRAYIRGLTHPDDLDGAQTEEETPEPTDNTPSVSHASGPSNNIPPILLLDSEVVEVEEAPDEPEEEQEMNNHRAPAQYRHEEVTISQPEIVVAPHLVPLAMNNREFKIIMRRVRMDCGELLWDVRLYRGRNNNPPGWEPVRRDEDSSSDSDDNITDRESA